MMFSSLFLRLSIFLLVVLASCQPAKKSGNIVSEAHKTDSCSANSLHSYEVYIPALPEKEIKDLPLLILLDPHGKGLSALEHFKKAAQHYPAIVVASNYIRNNFGGFEQEIQRLINDVRGKYPVGNTLYLAGFSGGARMALAYGVNHNTNGLILCGALANQQQLSLLHCPVIAISGMDDFNFPETAQYLMSLPSAPQNLKIVVTDDSHSWPKQSVLTNALGLLYYHSGQHASLHKKQFKQYGVECQQQIDSLTKAQSYLKAALAARNLVLTSPFDKDKSLGDVYRTLLQHPGYLQQLKKLRATLVTEQKAKQQYYQALTQKDSVWWNNELKANKRDELLKKDIFEQSLYKRIRAFWGIACYSICNNAQQAHQADKLEQILPIYKTVEPENPDVYYFSALLPYWQNNMEETVRLLQKAVRLGYTDYVRLESTFPKQILDQIALK